MTVRELLKYGEKLAIDHNKEGSAIKLLLMHFLEKESYELIMNMDKAVNETLAAKYKEGVSLYVIENIPVQHIIGFEHFYGYQFIVGPEVLIPRFETEELVAKVLSCYDEYFHKELVDVVDVGTGSGAIAITLSLEEEMMNVDATDISEEALKVAKENAKNLNAKVNFLSGDMLEPLIESGKKYDILVSNPPYIPEEEYVESLVKDNEPHLALFGGNDGMVFYEKILKNAHHILKPKSMIAFEHGWNQKEKMEVLIKKYFPKSKYEIIKDMNGKDRITIIYN
ncbi:peptide chain release factor N(5)-glutamine methyltransferase [Mycoplasmatota bacterium]|nr:peptide chain release factor N(5)-glutamine methyltransferase [Mycoplasmatota bacterium]